MNFGSVIVFLVALATSRFANWAIYSWGINVYQFGPWSKPVKDDKRDWKDHLPIIGWYRLSRTAKEHGKGFWIRPLLIELLYPIAMTAYFFFITNGGMLPEAMRNPIAIGIQPWLYWQFVGHFVLFSLMLIATFIDFDEQSIPDFVTVPGTIVGLFGAAFASCWLPLHAVPPKAVEMHAYIPKGFPASLSLGSSTGLGYALLILAIWGFALLDRAWITRRGIKKAFEYLIALMFRRIEIWASILSVTVFLLIFVTIYYQNNGARWDYLWSSLFGLAFAGGITWAVRRAATTGLGVEALGFGDVTLMAMIGTFLGWQASVFVFFISPMVAIAFVFVRWVITRNSQTPYGPYLCAGTVLVMLYWDPLWRAYGHVFSLGPELIIGIILAFVVLMGVLLWIWRLIKNAIGLGGY